MKFLIQPRRSMVLFILFILLHCAAFAILILVSLLFPIRLLFIGALFANFIYSLRRHVFFLDPRSVVRCWREVDGTWRIQLQNGFVGAASLLRNSFVSRYLMLLSFKIDGRRFPVALPLAFDSASKEILRQLRVLSNEAA